MKKNRIAVSRRARRRLRWVPEVFSRGRRLSAAEMPRGRPQARTRLRPLKPWASRVVGDPICFIYGFNSNFLSSISFSSYDEGGAREVDGMLFNVAKRRKG